MKKNHGRLLSMALSGAMVVSSLSMTVPMTAFAASPTGIEANVVVATKALDTNAAFAVSAGLTDALVTSTAETLDYAKVGFTIDDTAVVEEDAVVTLADLTEGELRGATNYYDGVMSLTGLKPGVYYVHAWNYSTDESGPETALGDYAILGTSEAITVYHNHVGAMDVTSTDKSIALNQGSITATATGTLNVPSKTDATSFNYVVVSEADYDDYQDALDNNEVIYDHNGTPTAGRGATILSGKNLIGENKGFALDTSATIVNDTNNGAYISREVVLTNNKLVTPGKYYLVASETNIAAALTTTIPVIDAYEFTVTQAEGAGLVIGTGLSDNRKIVKQAGTAGTIANLYFGTDVPLKAYVLNDDGVTYSEADSSKLTWISSRPAYVKVDGGVLKAVKAKPSTETATTPASLITVKYDVAGVEAANDPVSAAVTVTNVSKDTYTVSLENAKTYLNKPNKLTVKNLAQADVTDEVTWTVKIKDGGEYNDTTDAKVESGKFVASKTGTYRVVAKSKNSYAEDANSVDIVVSATALSVSTKSGTAKSDEGRTKVYVYGGQEIEGFDVVDDKDSVARVYLKAGDSLTLEVDLDKVDKTKDSGTVYTSDDEDVATFKNGVITAVGAGTANLTISRADAVAPWEITATVIGVEEDYQLLDSDLNNEITLYEGESVEGLNLFVDGTKTTMISAIWNSADPTIASVSTRGKVTAKTAGNTIVYLAAAIVGDDDVAEYVEPYAVNVLAKDSVIFTHKVNGIEEPLDPYECVLNVGNTKQFNAVINGKSAEGTWSSEDEDIATVNTKGLVTAKATTMVDESETGEPNWVNHPINITFTPKDATVAPQSITLTVNPETFDVYAGVKNITAGLAESVAVGGKVQLAIKNGTEDVTSTTKFKSADETIVKVSSTGLITGVKANDDPVDVTISKNGETVAIVAITVIDEQKTTSISLEPGTLDLVTNGESKTLKAIVEPVGTADALTWTTDDKGAVIALKNNGDGTVTVSPVAIGTATITATSGNFVAKCKVTVTQSKEDKAKEEAAKEKAKQDAISTATAAAAAAEKDPSDANIAALEKAIATAKEAGASDADVKAAQEKLTAALKTAKANSDKTAADNKTAADKANQEATAAKADAANQKKAADAAKAEAEKNQKALDKANAKVATSETIAKLAGKTKKVSGSSYKTDADGGKSVTVTKAKNAKTVTIGKTVKISKNTYKVRSIKAKAFTGKKIRTLKINGANLLFVDNYAFKSTKATKITVTNAKNVKAQLKAAATAAGLKYSAKGNTVTITKK